MIEVLAYKAIKKGGQQGIVNLKITKFCLVLNECKVFKKDKRRFIGLPTKTYEKDGVKKYSPLVLFDDREMGERFNRQALEAIDEYIAQEKQKEDALRYDQNKKTMPTELKHADDYVNFQ